MLRITQEHPQELIPQAFRSAIKLVHPDKNQDCNKDLKEATIQMYDAYRILNDPVLRKLYDCELQQKLRKEQVDSHRYF